MFKQAVFSTTNGKSIVFLGQLEALFRQGFLEFLKSLFISCTSTNLHV